jgi:hypothetical protein
MHNEAKGNRSSSSTPTITPAQVSKLRALTSDKFIDPFKKPCAEGWHPHVQARIEADS